MKYSISHILWKTATFIIIVSLFFIWLGSLMVSDVMKGRCKEAEALAVVNSEILRDHTQHGTFEGILIKSRLPDSEKKTLNFYKELGEIYSSSEGLFYAKQDLCENGEFFNPINIKNFTLVPTGIPVITHEEVRHQNIEFYTFTVLVGFMCAGVYRLRIRILGEDSRKPVSLAA